MPLTIFSIPSFTLLLTCRGDLERVLVGLHACYLAQLVALANLRGMPLLVAGLFCTSIARLFLPLINTSLFACKPDAWPPSLGFPKAFLSQQLSLALRPSHWTGLRPCWASLRQSLSLRQQVAPHRRARQTTSLLFLAPLTHAATCEARAGDPRSVVGPVAIRAFSPVPAPLVALLACPRQLRGAVLLGCCLPAHSKKAQAVG